MGTGRIVNDLGYYRNRLLKSCGQEAVVAWGEVENAFGRYLGDEISRTSEDQNAGEGERAVKGES